MARYTATLRRFYQYLTANGLTLHKPTIQLGEIKFQTKLPNTPTEDEVAEFLDITELNSHRGLGDKAILETLYATGLRTL